MTKANGKAAVIVTPAVQPTTPAEPTHAELLAKIALLEKAVANKASQGTSLRVSVKGAVSTYGLGRFPVTLYMGQWLKLAEDMPKILAFIEANKHLLATKESPVVAAQATATV